MAIKYRELGHTVRFVSLTNGDAGHYTMGKEALATRRKEETQAAAKVADIQYDVLDISDGELMPDLQMRKQVIRIMRESNADLVLCHRPCDYHPDHRAVGMLVQDASHLVSVPLYLSEIPHLPKAPVIGYFWDRFTQPKPFRPDIVVDIEDVFEKKVDIIHCHVSQMYECDWMPDGQSTLNDLPSNEKGRREWLRIRMERRVSLVADKYRDALISSYGTERGNMIKHAEAIELSEYGTQATCNDIARLFPFMPTA
jgi:LmbE family N-acetylglucosaminyl deacetylase